MVRKGLSFAFGLALIVMLGFAMADAHSHALKTPSESNGFSIPYEPAPPALKAAEEFTAVSTTDSTCAAEDAKCPDGVVERYRDGRAARTTVPTVPWTFPPLFRRPPPANS